MPKMSNFAPADRGTQIGYGSLLQNASVKLDVAPQAIFPLKIALGAVAISEQSVHEKQL